MSTHAPNILLVEDDPDVRESVSTLLEDEGYVVHQAENGRVALDTLAALPEWPCLILLDLMMPVMSGSEFLAELRATRSVTVPVVILSAWPREAAGPAGTQGANGFLRKPISLDSLLAAVEEHCPRRGLPA